jgi:hypothetical protein
MSKRREYLGQTLAKFARKNCSTLRVRSLGNIFAKRLVDRVGLGVNNLLFVPSGSESKSVNGAPLKSWAKQRL